MRDPDLSVVIPSYNQGEFLGQCLDSVLSQRWDGRPEVIVLDGGSTDSSVDVIRRHEKHLAFWRSAKDAGQAAAVAEGFARAKGAFLYWINSDDFLLPGAFESFEQARRRRPATFYYGGIVDVDAAGKPLRERPTSGVNAWTFRYRGMIAYSMASFFSRSLYLQAGPVNPTFRFAMDLDLFLRMLPHARCERLDSPHLIAAFRLHEASKTSTLEDVRIAESISIRRLHGSWPTGNALSRARWRLGWGLANAYRAALMVRDGYGMEVAASALRELRGANDLSPISSEAARRET